MIKTLVTPAISYPIQSLIPSLNGKLMAVVGNNSLSVIVLPRRAYTKSRSPTVETRSYTVIESQNEFNLLNPIVKVRWHPLSETKTHLCVLNKNGTLRLTDVLINFIISIWIYIKIEFPL